VVRELDPCGAPSGRYEDWSSPNLARMGAVDDRPGYRQRPGLSAGKPCGSPSGAVTNNDEAEQFREAVSLSGQDGRQVPGRAYPRVWRTMRTLPAESAYLGQSTIHADVDGELPSQGHQTGG
jgi:hypothetical protein